MSQEFKPAVIKIFKEAILREKAIINISVKNDEISYQEQRVLWSEIF